MSIGRQRILLRHTSEQLGPPLSIAFQDIQTIRLLVQFEVLTSNIGDSDIEKSSNWPQICDCKICLENALYFVNIDHMNCSDENIVHVDRDHHEYPTKEQTDIHK
jgi:hypothetical protein